MLMKSEVFDGHSKIPKKRSFFTEACSLLKRAVAGALPPWLRSCTQVGLDRIRAHRAWFPLVTDAPVLGARHTAPSVAPPVLGVVDIRSLPITKTLLGSLLNGVAKFLC